MSEKGEKGLVCGQRASPTMAAWRAATDAVHAVLLLCKTRGTVDIWTPLLRSSRRKRTIKDKLKTHKNVQGEGGIRVEESRKKVRFT